MKKNLYGLVIVDTAILPPSDKPPKFDFKIRANKIYKSLKEIKSRFRLVPGQIDALEYIMDYIAEKSIKKNKGGWTWKFDPNYMKIFKLQECHMPNLFLHIQILKSFLYR